MQASTGGKIVSTVLSVLSTIKFISFMRSFSKIANGFRQIGKGFGKLEELFEDFKKNGIRYTRTDIFKKGDPIGTTLLKMAGSIGILVASMLVISRMDTADVMKSLLVIGAIGAELAIIAGIFKAGAADGKPFLMMAASLALMIIPIKLLSGLDATTALKGMVAIGLIMTEMALFTRMAKGGPGEKPGFLSLAPAINLLVIAIKQLSGMDMGGMVKGVAALGVIFLELSRFTRKAGDKKVKGLISMALALNLMAIAVKALGKMNTGSLLKGILAIGGIVAAFTVLAKSLGGMSFGKSITMLLTIAGTLVLFIGAFKEIDGLNTNSMLSFSGSLSAVLLSLALSMKLLGSLPITGALMGVANMAVAIAGIGAIIVGLGALKDSWAGMTGLLESGGEVFRLIGNALGQFIGGIGSGIVEGLDLPDMGTQLSDFMTNAQDFLDGAKSIDDSTTSGIESLAGAIGAIATSELQTWLVSLFRDDDPITAFADDIVELGRALSAYGLSILPLAAIPTGLLDKSVSVAEALADVATQIPPTGGVAQFLSGIGDMSTFSSKLKTLGSGLADFATEISSVENDGFDQDKLEVAVKIAEALARLNTSIPEKGGLMQAITGVQSLAAFGKDTESFGDGITAFIDEVRKMPALSAQDKDKLETVIAVGEALSQMERGLEAQGGWVDEIEGIKSLSSFSTGFDDLAEGLNTFIGQVRLIVYTTDDETQMNKVLDVATALSTLEKNLEAQGGMADDFEGVKSLASFGDQFPDFAAALNSFITIVSGVKGYNQTKINDALSVAQAISDLEAKLPATDGWWQSVVGNKDLSLFSTNVTKLGSALASFAKDIAGVDMGNSENAISVMGLIGDFISSLSESGGLLDDIGKWFGGSSEDSLLTITQTMANVGTNLNTFATSLTDISFEGKLDTASKMFADMETFVKCLDLSGSLWQTLANVFGAGNSKNTLENISGAMATFGSSMRTLSDGISDVGTASTNFDKAKLLFNSFKEFGDAYAEGEGSLINYYTFNDIGDGLVQFGTHLCTFAAGISAVNVSDLSGAVGIMESLVSLAGSAGNVTPTNVQNVAAILEKYANTDFSTAGHTLGGSFITAVAGAIQNEQAQVAAAVKQLATAGSSEAKKYYAVWKNAGVYLASGLANGIAAMAGSVKRAAANAAAGATGAIQLTWSIHSPSRVGRDLGMNFDLGIAGGIGEYSRVVSSQATGMGERAVEAAKKMLRGVDFSVFDNLDPNPTIRPVLDLDNVQRGVNAIDGMLAREPTMNTALFRGINVSQNAGMLNFDGAKILGSQNNKDVVQELRTLTGRFDRLSEAVENMQLVLDTGVLVGQTSAKMDSQLGILATRKGRGN